MARVFWGCSTSCFTYSFLIQVIREKTLGNVLLAIWELFLHENNQIYNSYRFIDKFAFILLLSFLTDQKQDSDFQQVGGLLTRNITDLCLERVLFYFKAMPISADFFKGYKQKIIQFIRRNQVYFSSSNVSTDTTVIVKDYICYSYSYYSSLIMLLANEEKTKSVIFKYEIKNEKVE